MDERWRDKVVSQNNYRKSLGLPTVCRNCGRFIQTMIFKGSDWCSDNCRKALQETEKK